MLDGPLPQGEGGGAETFVFLSVYPHTFCVSVHVSVSVCVPATCESAQLGGRGGSEGGFVCFVSIRQYLPVFASICRQRREEVVDVGFIPASQSKLDNLL